MKTIKTFLAIAVLSAASLTASTVTAAEKEIKAQISLELSQSIELIIQENNKEMEVQLMNSLFKTLENINFKVLNKETLEKFTDELESEAE